MKLPAGWRLEYRESVGSTNDVAKTFDTGNVVVRADEQTAGRGRFNRVWQSPAGNLYCSFAFTPDLNEGLTRYSFAVAVALHETVQSFKPDADVVCKWPNDILIAGKKVSGILLELTGIPEKPRLIAGIGVNIVSFPQDASLLYRATSLSEQNIAADADAVLEKLADRIGFWTRQPADAVVRAFADRVYGIGKPITVSLPVGKIDGVFKAIDDDGALLLDTGDGTVRRIMAGDVFYQG